MKLRFIVALAAAITMSAGACSKKAEEAPEPAAAETAKADEAKVDEAAKGDEAKVDEADEAKADEADEAKADEAPAALDGAGDPMKRALTLQRKALELLKANKGDAKAAAAALEAFQKENAAEIETLKKDLEAMGEKLKDDPSAAMAMVQKYSADLQEMQKLTMDLMKEAPDLMGSPEVAAAMAKLSPGAGTKKEDAVDDDGMDGGEEAITDEGADEDAVPAAKLTDEDKALLEDMMATQEKMIEILEANAADPDKAGDALSAFYDENKDKLQKLADVQKRLQGDQAAAMEFAQKHMGRITAIATKLSEIVKNSPELLTNEKVATAMRKLNGAE